MGKGTSGRKWIIMNTDVLDFGAMKQTKGDEIENWKYERKGDKMIELSPLIAENVHIVLLFLPLADRHRCFH